MQDFHRKLVKRGVWERMMDTLRQQVRQQAGRDPEPSVIVMDSQSVKMTEKGDLVALMGTNG